MDAILRDSLHPQLSLSLAKAQQRIVHSLTPLAPETVSLDLALGRLPVRSIKSTLPKPSFCQSTRDGYAICDSLSQQGKKAAFRLIGEVAAGSLESLTLCPGEAVRIMTGALVPIGCRRVVPFEVCREEGEAVIIPDAALAGANSFIRRRGQDLPKGRVIAGHGKRLSPDNLLLLAENGWSAVDVYQRPGVVILCTGSELVYPGRKLLQGQKVSGNGVLLRALVEEEGGECLNVDTVADTTDEIVAALEDILTGKPDMILTTGGMGPGKFDLLERIFARLGGDVVYNSLQVRPGKSTMYGHLAGIPLFALPGPPPAVRLLFHELVAPGLCKLQGMRRPFSPLVKARSLEPISAGKSHHLNLKGGVAILKDTTLFVRPAGRQDTINAILHITGRKTTCAVDDVVPVRLTRSFM